MSRITFLIVVLASELLNNAQAGSDFPASSAPQRHTELEACLNASMQSLVLPGHEAYEEARHCVNRRPDIVPAPVAIVQPKSAHDVQLIVQCAAQARVPVCARGGRHGFDNDAGCSGGVAVDLRELQLFQADRDAKQTTFGAGHCLGQLYHKLAQGPKPLLVPAGAVNGVGAAGLILGCGRGLTTQLHGLACDSLHAIEYVDAQGTLQIANASSNSDMLWMAKGSGGNFPGIVTQFTMQAFEMPKEILSLKCTFPAHEAHRIIQAWLARGHELADPERKLFTSLQMWNRPAIAEIFLMCVGCTGAEKRWQRSVMEDIASHSPSNSCGSPHERRFAWLEYILYESGYEHGMFKVPDGRPINEGLLDCNNGWGNQGDMTASKNGGHMGFEWTASDELVDDVLYWTHTETPEQHYGLMVEWYLTGGPKVAEVRRTDTAYGPREAKWVLHYKHQWPAAESDSKMGAMMEHHTSMSRAIDRHLPCSNFYNYMDKDMPCASTNDQWLEAHFSDVQRMKDIKAARDPHGVFRSRLATSGDSFNDTASLPAPAPVPSPAPEPNPSQVSSTCYGSFSSLVADEGSGVGDLGTSSPTECQTECTRTADCQSFSLCPQWNACWMKDRILTGNETMKSNGECQTYFKKACSDSPVPTSTSTTMPIGDGAFEPVDGAVGRACRGVNSADNSPSYYFLAGDRLSLLECQQICIQTPLCVGVEHSRTRCEVWIRSGGIGASIALAGSSCYHRMAQANPFQPVDGGIDRACRGSNSADNNPSYYTISSGVASLAHCQHRCVTMPGCQGVEYSSGRCELWTRIAGIGATTQLAGFMCLRYEEQSNSSSLHHQPGNTRRLDDTANVAHRPGLQICLLGLWTFALGVMASVGQLG